MRSLRRPTVMLGLAALLLLLAASPAAAEETRLKDIADSWAREEIDALVDQGVVDGYPDGTFRPGRRVTRAESAKMMISAFEKINPGEGIPFPDAKGHWAEPYIAGLVAADIIEIQPGGNFRPDYYITHAEMATMLIRTIAPDLLGSNGDASGQESAALDTSDWPQSFTDVGPDHRAFRAVELANRLNILPPAYINEFDPGRATTRAEAAAMIVAAQRVKVRSGEISGVNAAYGTFGLQTAGGVRGEITVPPTALIYRNTVPTELDALQEGDKVRVVTDSTGDAQLVQAYGLVTREDVFGKVTELTQGLLTKDQLRAIANGDWEAAQRGLRATVYDRLLEIGTTPAEAESILLKDWDSLTLLAKERVARAVSEEYGVSPALVDSLLSGEWEGAWNLLQDEAMTRLMSSLLI